MNFKTTLKTSTLACAIAATSGAWAFPIDLDGAGVAAGTKNVATIDPAPGNAIVTCTGAAMDLSTGAIYSTAGCSSVPDIEVGDIVQNFGHSTVSALLNSAGENVSPAFGGNHEWSIIFGFTEVVVEVDAAGPFGDPANASFVTLPGGINFFEIYYSPKNASNLAGTGFTDGTKILGGSVLGYDGLDGTGFSAFTVSSTSTLPLDTFGTDQYTSIDSITGTGSTKLKVDVAFQDFAFFKAPLTELTLTFDSTLNNPFSTVNPSSCFYVAAGAAAPTFLGAGNGYGPCDGGLGAGTGTATGSVGAVNGVSGPNQMFQIDASIPVPGVPEPGMLGLIGLGFATAGLVSRRRRSA